MAGRDGGYLRPAVDAGLRAQIPFSGCRGLSHSGSHRWIPGVKWTDVSSRHACRCCSDIARRPHDCRLDTIAEIDRTGSWRIHLLRRVRPRHFLRTYHNHENRSVLTDCKSLILNTERCWSGRSGTLGNRRPPRVLTHSTSHQLTSDPTTSATSMSVSVSP